MKRQHIALILIILGFAGFVLGGYQPLQVYLPTWVPPFAIVIGMVLFVAGGLTYQLYTRKKK